LVAHTVKGDIEKKKRRTKHEPQVLDRRFICRFSKCQVFQDIKDFLPSGNWGNALNAIPTFFSPNVVARGV